MDSKRTFFTPKLLKTSRTAYHELPNKILEYHINRAHCRKLCQVALLKVYFDKTATNCLKKLN